MGSRVFLASSTQAKPLMDRLAGWLKTWGLEPLPWNKIGLFRPGDYILQRLLEIASEVDGAFILFGDEDQDWYHADAQPQPRDNVLIEYGIFASRLGRERTIICRSGRPKTASDLGGLVFVQFDAPPKGTTEARRRLQDWAKVLPALIGQARDRETAQRRVADAPLPSRLDAVFAVQSDSKQTLSIVTGSLREIRDVDVIVSSENTDLQPSRIDERSMSGTLRYLDAVRNTSDLHVRRDAYVESLEAAKMRDGVQVPVLPGAVVAATTTGLRDQGVRYVFHAAIVQGHVETGYTASGDTIDLTVKNCFRRFSELALPESLSSILFPLFGAGSGRLTADEAARRLMPSILDAMRTNPLVVRVFLFAFVESHRRALREAAQEMGLKELS